MAEKLNFVEMYETLQNAWNKHLERKNSLAKDFLEYYMKKSYLQGKQIKKITIEFH